MYINISKSVLAILVSASSVVALSACAQTNSQTKPAVTYYSECGDLAFKNADNSPMTKSEELAALDEDFFEVLNQSEECMSQAASGSNGRIAGAGGGSGSGSGGGAGNGAARGRTGDPASVCAGSDTDCAAGCLACKPCCALPGSAAGACCARSAVSLAGRTGGPRRCMGVSGATFGNG